MIPLPHFRDRHVAGRRLGEALARHAYDHPLIVLGLPRGGVPVAAAVAEALDAPLDVFIVRKLGVPDNPELAMGAIGSGGTSVLNRDVIHVEHVSREAIDRAVAAERLELERRELLYRYGSRIPVLAGETVIVVDDGSATGASMRVAVHAIRQLSPARIIAAVPVASRLAIEILERGADECVSVISPDPFLGVGVWYSDFSETTDDEVRRLLDVARRRWDAAPMVLAGH